MNFEMTKSDVKGGEEITLTFWPSDNLEREFFNALFAGEDVKIDAIPNTDQNIVIRKVIKVIQPA